MSGDVGVDDPAPESDADSTPAPACADVMQTPLAPQTQGEPQERPAEAVPAAAIVVAPQPSPRPLAPVAPGPPNPFADGERAVQTYIRSQLSPRSRDNALDALRRLSRLMLRDQNAEPAQIPWPAIGYEQATTIRTALFEMTRVGALTPGSANLTLSHLRGLIRTMYGLRLVTADQHELIHSGALKNIPGVRKPRGRALSAVEERALRQAARGLDGYQGAMLDTAIVVAIGAGLRREEIARLALEGLSPGQLQVVGKGNKEKRMPVDPQMQAAIDDWLEERTLLAPVHEGLFCSPQKPDWALSAWSFWALVRTASHHAFGDRESCEKGCQCIEVVTGPHDFRRTFATRLLDQGFDIRQVQVLMDHESPETTARYDKREETALFEKRRSARVIA